MCKIPNFEQGFSDYFVGVPINKIGHFQYTTKSFLYTEIKRNLKTEGLADSGVDLRVYNVLAIPRVCNYLRLKFYLFFLNLVICLYFDFFY
jgi:hypothetical protein